jgi:hypothetical protein
MLSHARQSRFSRASLCVVLHTALTVTFLLVAASLLSRPSYGASPIFEHSYPLSADGSFALENFNGSVRIEGWDRNEVEVTAVKIPQASGPAVIDDHSDLDSVKIDIQSQPRKIAVRTLYPHGEGAEVAVEYRIHVPYRALLQGIATVNGAVQVRGVKGGGVLRSVNGDVDVRESSGRFSAQTTNGNVHLELRKLIDGAPMNLATVNGSVVLGLPADARANLQVVNVNGSFVSELPVTASDGAVSTREFHGRLGAGGGEILVRTINGGVRLVREPATLPL